MRPSSADPTHRGRPSKLSDLTFYKVKTNAFSYSHFSEQSTGVLKEVNYVFFHQARNHEAIKVKGELKVLIMFLISFSVVAANGNGKSIYPKVPSASTSIFHDRLLCCTSVKAIILIKQILGLNF